MSEIDDVVRRTVDMITTIASRVSRFAGRVLIVTVLIVGVGFWLGIEALSGGIETVWIVLAVAFGALAVGFAAVGWWRVWSVKRHTSALGDEVRSLVADGYDPSNTVIETFEVVDGETGNSSAIVMSRQMGGFQREVSRSPGRYRQLSAATRAITTFPLLVLGATAISIVFAFLGFVFLVALALGA